jgi:hypothetical protein
VHRPQTAHHAREIITLMALIAYYAKLFLQIVLNAMELIVRHARSDTNSLESSA